jgi:AraC family transcriptional regulator of adaptative response/methylated-DNA-[protein]-cysteine methyltransferase
MTNFDTQHVNYQRIAKAIHYLNEHQETQPSLQALSSYVGLSETHLQRTFTEWAGVSPKQFLQYLTKEKAKQCLRDSSVLTAAHSCGLSGGGRLHDLMIQHESVTPGEYKKWGAGLEISYGVHHTPFGHCFIASTHRGICKLAFIDTLDETQNVLEELYSEWPQAVFKCDQTASRQLIDAIFSPHQTADQKLKVLIKGSPFQLKVWEALLSIPAGYLFSYQQLAEQFGQSSAVRAAASAIARNKIAYLIPCHRVIRNTGAINQYRWGAERKTAMIAWEQSNIS